jgi:putative transposase
LRNIEELFFERGVIVTYETNRCWCDKFSKGFARRAKAARPKPGNTWHIDEMFVTLRGEPYLQWRAVNWHGTDLDIVVQKRRDQAAAKCFFECILRSNPVPRKIVTDQLRSDPAAKAGLLALPNVKHVFVKVAADLNNRAEHSHLPTRDRERRIRSLRDPEYPEKSLHAAGRYGNISRSSAIRYARQFSANNSQPGSRRGANALTFTQNPSAGF